MLIDMPVEELKKYQGSTPRPDDFDEFWDASLAESAALPLNAELIPAEFQAPCADCCDLFFDGTGNSRIHAKLLCPKNDTGKHPAVVQFHGYAGDSLDWCTKLMYIACGYTMAVLDCRGQGGLSEDRNPVRGNTLNGHIIRGLDEPDPRKLYFRNVFLDCARLTRFVMNMEHVDHARVGVSGVSQGGGLTLACAALVPEVKLAATVFPFLSDYRRVWNMDLAVGAYGELKEYFRNFDPNHLREEAVWTRLGYIDIQNLAPRIRAKVMMQTGLMDTTCPPSTQFAAFNKIPSEKEVIFYPDYSHEWLKGGDDKLFQFMMKL